MVLGAGYNLVIVKSEDCNTDTLSTRIKTHVPTAQLQVRNTDTLTPRMKMHVYLYVVVY